jgi:hypothetical protein
MNWSERFAWLAALRRQHESDTADPDRAGMGTAFGLDASFDRFAPPTLPPDAVDALVEATPWEKRLVRRSGL